MKRIIIAACVVCAAFPPLPAQGDYYTFDNQSGDWSWNNPVNWGLAGGNSNYNVAPTASDTAAFVRGTYYSPPGTILFTANGFAAKVRQEFSRVQRRFTIDPSQTVDRTLTLTGTSGLIDCSDAAVNVIFDGTPNANGARLKLKINGSGGSEGTPINEGLALIITCDVSGPGGFIVKRGLDGPGVGRLILGGSNTYTGPTTINAGRLYVDGSTAAGSAVSISSGCLLGGSGTIKGPVAVSAGGILSPGIATGIATLTVSNDLSFNGDLMVKVDKSLAQSNDTVVVSGTLTHSGIGTLQVLNFGTPLVTGDTFKIFNKPLVNGQTMLVLSAGTEVWTNKLAVDGTIAVLSATNPPITGNPTTVFTWKGSVTPYNPIEVPMQDPANWIENQAPAPLSSNIFVFQGDFPPPYNWPFIDTNYGTSILIFSNNATLNDTKVLAGSNHTMNLGSYVLQDSQKLAYFGITGVTPVKGSDGVTRDHYDACFTNALGDASCGSQTEFMVTGGARLDWYGVLRDGAGTHSRLVKSGNAGLNLTGNWRLGNDPNTYSGGTVINAGYIKLAKLAGFNAIPGDVTVNGTGQLIMNNGAGHQIADSAIVTLNHSGRLSLGGYPETVGTVQGGSTSASVSVGSGTLTVAPSASAAYNSGVGISDYAGSISGSGTVIKNGTGTWGMLGANSISKVTVNAGTLKLNGKTGTGAVTVNSGGTLLGQGTIAGAVTVASGGMIGAGFSAGKVTFSSGLNLSAGGDGATNVWELAALKDSATGVPGTDFDQIVLTGGTLALGTQATLDIRFAGSAPAPAPSIPFWQSSHTWTIIRLSGASNPGPSKFGRVKNGSYAAGIFTVTNASGDVLLTFTPQGEPPSIVVQPRSIAIISGQAGSFDVTAAGASPFAYQWRFNGSEIADATKSFLTIPAVQSPDQGLYSVRVANAFGSVTSSNALLVLTPVGATGNNSFDQSRVPLAATNAVALSAGAWHNLALCADGTVVAWGNNWDGQCNVPEGLNHALAIAAGGYHSLALNAGQNVVAWGANANGQSSVPGDLGKVTAVAAGLWHSLALQTNGTVVGWGDNSFGQTNVPAGLSNVVAIAAGGAHSLALKSNGRVVGWGSNLDPLGNYAGQANVPLNLSDVVAISAGGYHSLALRADGSVVAWGYNGQHQSSVPAGLSNVIAVAGGGYHSLALKQDRTIVGWGDDTQGQIAWLPTLSNVVAIAGGEFHTLALVGGPPVVTLPRITTITLDDTGNATVNYANTLPGINYVLSYSTNLGTTNWFPAGIKTASGPSDSQTDTSATNNQRYYRVYYATP